MPQSLSRLLVHVIFSTKFREPILEDTVRPQLHAVIGGVVDGLRGTLLRAGSVEDHIHLFIAHPRTCAPADLVEAIKVASSKFLKTQGDRYQHFHWQHGYGIFSVSSSHRAQVEAYIDHQHEHHHGQSYQDEFRAFLIKHELEFDERYVWD